MSFDLVESIGSVVEFYGSLVASAMGGGLEVVWLR